MTKKQMAARIAELEHEVATLKAQSQTHFHYHIPEQTIIPNYSPYWSVLPYQTTNGANPPVNSWTFCDTTGANN